MGRYNIPKADSKELINEVQNSSSGDGGAKEYYYKLLAPQDQLPGMIVSMRTTAFATFLVKNKKGVTETAIVLSDENYIDHKGPILPYIKVYDIPYQYVSLVDDSLYAGNVYNLGSGDIFDRMAKVMGTDIQTIKEQLKDIIQEITKEEYESLITYKP